LYSLPFQFNYVIGSPVIIEADQTQTLICAVRTPLACTDSAACNYNQDAMTDDGSCVYSTDLDACATCSGAQDGTGVIVDNDSDDDTVCDNFEVVGCENETACNYNNLATDSDNCIYSTDLDECASCSGAQDGTGIIVDNDSDDDTVCNNSEVVGCEDETACNYNNLATDSDNCIYSIDLNECASCSGVQDGTGTIVDNDLDNDTVCNENEVIGCEDTTACNYNNLATDSDNCIYSTDLDVCASCSGAQDGTGVIVDNDLDDDTVCNDNEVVGCEDATACNYNNTATDSDNCIYSTDLDVCASCSGAQDGTGTIVDNDLDDDTVCNDNEVVGCEDTTACNYNNTATDSDNSCTYTTDLDACATCSGEQDGSGLIVDNDLDNDTVCSENEISGCIDVTACNYDADPTTDSDNSCVYIDGCQECSGAQDGTGTIVDIDGSICSLTLEEIITLTYDEVSLQSTEDSVAFVSNLTDL
jgi:hypothetical protein